MDSPAPPTPPEAGGERKENASGGTESLEGQSLVPLLHGEAMEEKPVLAEILCEGAIAPCFMVRRGQYKYIYSDPDPDQLFDLEADPNELENRAGQPAFEDLRRELRADVDGRWDWQAIHRQVLESQARRRLVAEALAMGSRVSWDFQPFQDAAELYMRGHMDLDSLERRARFPAPAVPEPDSEPVPSALA